MSKYIKLEDAIERAKRGTNNYYICKAIENLPTIEVSEDCISREWLLNYTHAEDVGTPDEMWKPAREWVNAIKNAPSVVPSDYNLKSVDRLLNDIEEICKDIRELHVDDSVCGLCEYDADHGLDGHANECPGYERNDCFKLSEEYKAKMKG